LYKIGGTLTKLEKDVDSSKPGAQQRLKSFRAERILKVDAIVQVRVPLYRPFTLEIYSSTELL
jgi:hypothetical protein